MQKINVGFLGCGNIGGGVWALLEDMKADIAQRYQVCFEVKRMLVRALDEKRAVVVPEEKLTTCVDDILNDPEIELVCEFMGGEQPAADFMLRALISGKSVVTANKMALSLHWQELHDAAAQTGAKLFYEASVCGAIPVIRAIRESLTGTRIESVRGIVNGTTNYILSEMSAKGLAYETALAQAQQLGLAEPDPTSDVEGYDAAYKLSILSALCFGVCVHPNDVSRTGVTGVDIRDIQLGRQLGLRMKLLAQAERTEKGVFACVTPTFVAKENQLFNVNGSFNAVLLHGHSCDDIFLYGRGAGSLPTASAIVADMIQCACMPSAQNAAPCILSQDTVVSDADRKYYIRIENAPAAEITALAEKMLPGTEVFALRQEESDYTVLITPVVASDACDAFITAMADRTYTSAVVWPIEGTV